MLLKDGSWPNKPAKIRGLMLEALLGELGLAIPIAKFIENRGRFQIKPSELPRSHAGKTQLHLMPKSNHTSPHFPSPPPHPLPFIPPNVTPYARPLHVLHQTQVPK